MEAGNVLMCALLLLSAVPLRARPDGSVRLLHAGVPQQAVHGDAHRAGEPRCPNPCCPCPHPVHGAALVLWDGGLASPVPLREFVSCAFRGSHGETQELDEPCSASSFLWQLEMRCLLAACEEIVRFFFL